MDFFTKLFQFFYMDGGGKAVDIDAGQRLLFGMGRIGKKDRI